MMSFLKILFFSILCTFSLNATDLKKVSLQLQWKYQFQFAGYIMAKEKGFYKESGLDVDIKEWKHPINSVDELVNNHSQYATLRPTALIDIAEGKELVFLAAIFQSSPLILLADKSSNITTIKDFKNKKMMSTGDLHSDASLLSMMFSQGLKIEDIKIIEPSFDVKDLLNKKTDLIASYISNEPFVLKEKGGTPVVFNPKDYGYDFYNDLLTVSKGYMDKNKEEVEKFRNATLKGWEYAFANIDETVEILYTKYNSQKKSKNAFTYEGEELKKLAYAGTAKIGLIEKEKLAKIYDVYKLLGMVKKSVNYNQIIYNHVSNEMELTQSEKEHLKQKGKIKVCIDPNWMPFEQFDKNGKHTGMTSDYYKLFEQFISTPFEIISSKTWAESLELAQKRECDILSLAMETPERKKYMNFTTPYLSVPVVVATKLNHSFVAQIDDLKKDKLGITKGYAYVEILRTKYPFLNFIEIENSDVGLKKVQSGEIDGYIDGLAAIAYALQQEYGGELKVAGKFDEASELGIGVRNDDAILLSILQKTVNNLKEDQRREILNKWISIKVENGIDYDLVWKVVALSFVIILIILIFFFKQKALKDKLKTINANLEKIVEEETSRRLEKEKLLIQQSKMAMMGEMIGAIAHQWRQPLNTLGVTVQDIEVAYKFGELNEEYLANYKKRSMHIIQTMSATIDDFRNFFSVNKKQEEFYIEDAINDVLNILSAQLKLNNIDIQFVNESADKHKYTCVKNELKQVILNILANAKDALLEKKPKNAFIKIDVCVLEDGKLEIAIEDSAGGVPEDIIDKVFDSNFTTKEEGKGTGIGLYMSKQIIEERMHGKLSVSNTDNGARFVVEII